MALLEFLRGEFAEFFKEHSRAGVGTGRRFKEFVVKSAEFIRGKVHVVTVQKRTGLRDVATKNNKAMESTCQLFFG